MERMVCNPRLSRSVAVAVMSSAVNWWRPVNRRLPVVHIKGCLGCLIMGAIS